MENDAQPDLDYVAPKGQIHPIETSMESTIVFPGGLRISSKGMEYRGVMIEDAGEAYSAMMKVLNGMIR